MLQGNENVNIELDGGLEELIAMTEFCDDEDADSVVAPSDVSFFTDCEDDDMTTAVSTDSEVHEQTDGLGQVPRDDLPLTSTHEIPETDLNVCSTHPVSNTLLQNNCTQEPITSVSSTSELNLDSSTQLYLHPSGFTVTGDNIDKNFRPSYQRQDRQTKSLHYFHAYAARTVLMSHHFQMLDLLLLYPLIVSCLLNLIYKNFQMILKF